jgi:hypothetical protein
MNKKECDLEENSFWDCFTCDDQLQCRDRRSRSCLLGIVILFCSGTIIGLVIYGIHSLLKGG